MELQRACFILIYLLFQQIFDVTGLVVLTFASGLFILFVEIKLAFFNNTLFMQLHSNSKQSYSSELFFHSKWFYRFPIQYLIWFTHGCYMVLIFFERLKFQLFRCMLDWHDGKIK